MTEKTDLPERVHDNIQAISALRAEEERSLSQDQRAVEALTRWIGRPRTPYALAFSVVVWMGYNALASALGGRPFDAPPFFMLQGVSTLRS